MILPKDSEIKQRVLQYLYEQRIEERNIQVSPRRGISILDLEPVVAVSILKQLRDKDLVSYTATSDGPSSIRITTRGITQIEEGASESRGNVNISTDNSRTIHTHGGSSTAIIGDNNQSTVNIATAIEQLVEKIEASDAPTNEKEEAKTLIKRAVNNPLIGHLLGGVVSGLTLGAMA